MRAPKALLLAICFTACFIKVATQNDTTTSLVTTTVGTTTKPITTTTVRIKTTTTPLQTTTTLKTPVPDQPLPQPPPPPPPPPSDNDNSGPAPNMPFPFPKTTKKNNSPFETTEHPKLRLYMVNLQEEEKVEKKGTQLNGVYVILLGVGVEGLVTSLLFIILISAKCICATTVNN